MIRLTDERVAAIGHTQVTKGGSVCITEQLRADIAE
jgi:hypothetical protein